MEIHVYNRGMVRQGIIDEFTTLMWIRRYWSIGEFKLLVPHSIRHAELLKTDNIIMLRGKDEAAEIRYVNMTADENGETIEVQGKFISRWIGKRILLRSTYMNETPQNVLYALVGDNIISPMNTARRISSMQICATDATINAISIEYSGERFSNLLTECENTAKAAGLGFRVITDIPNGLHSFSVYAGVDRTASQTTNRRCVFSDEYDNIATQDYTYSIENHKSTLYVGGEKKENFPQVVVEVGLAGGLDREEIYIDGSGIASTVTDGNGQETSMSDLEYRRTLAAKGTSESEQYLPSIAFNAVINPRSNMVYGVDYDVGDRVTCVKRAWGVSMDARITEVSETYQDNTCEIAACFGEGIPTLYDNMRKIAKNRR